MHKKEEEKGEYIERAQRKNTIDSYHGNVKHDKQCVSMVSCSGRFFARLDKITVLCSHNQLSFQFET